MGIDLMTDENGAGQIVEPTESNGLDRRRMLQVLGALGVGSVAFREVLAQSAESKATVTAEMIQRAQWLTGCEFSEDDRALMLEDVNKTAEGYRRLRQVAIDNGVAPALFFHPLGEGRVNGEASRGQAGLTESAAGLRPLGDENLAYLPVTELAALIRSGQVSSVELTRLYLARLRRFDKVLHCVITLTEESALNQAARMDAELASGRYRGPLHGIPWGAKDLLAYPGYPTTWGAKPYQNQVRKEKATVISRLEEAGAVLVAKLSVGALAWGDVWFGGTTKNPWNPEQGSSGSSAGPAAATAAGLVGFALGTETWGSIVSPCTRCGATGLRPTFGRVSRFGCMALSWSMDKIGPIARSVEDCALIFDAIHGGDGLDGSAVSRPFHWPMAKDVRTLRVGYVEALFSEERLSGIEDQETRQRVGESLKFDRATLDVVRGLGVKPVPIALPKSNPIEPLGLILTAEASAAFDELTRSGRDDELVRQVSDAWPNVFRQGQLIPAVEYIRANRIRALLMAEMEALTGGVDAYIAPSFGGNNLLLTNLTGHPAVVLPNGFRESDGTPSSITFTGRLYGDDAVLALAHAYQQATDFHLQRPVLKKG